MHGLNRRIEGIEPFLRHDAFDVLKDHDGIIDHNPDGKNQSEQGEGIDVKATDVDTRKRPDDRHWDGQNRNNGPPKILNKEENHRKYEEKSDQQGFDHLLDGFLDDRAAVARIDDVIAAGQGLFEAGNLIAHGLRGFEGVGAGCQLHRHAGGRMAIGGGGESVILWPQFDLGHIGQMHHRTIGQRLDDDGAELLGRAQAVLNGVARHQAARLFGEKADDFVFAIFVFLEHTLHHPPLQSFRVHRLEVFVRRQVDHHRRGIGLQAGIQIVRELAAPVVVEVAAVRAFQAGAHF